MANSFQIGPGNPSPFGATRSSKGVNFALVSRFATAVTLCLFDPHDKEKPIAEIPLTERTGDVWHLFVLGLTQGLCYGYRIDGPHTLPHVFDSQLILLDPYAKGVVAKTVWGEESLYRPLGLIDPSPFDWEGDQLPEIPMKDLVLYEMHLRGFTQHPSSNVTSPGTYLGAIEKIPHLLELGVNAISLLPIHEFNETEYVRLNPKTQEKLHNYWGYSTVNFFSPMTRYAHSKDPGAANAEFKALVKALHRNGIEVILDVVYNHTAEGNERGPILSFKGIDCSLYYILDTHGHYLNYTGCGNTVSCNHPVVQELIRDSLRYFVTEMHVDGFRFDLASILTRGRHGELLSFPPIVDSFSHDPILSKIKLIAEPWDAVGLYQVGNFYPQEDRWAEWNGKYRDTMRRFMNGSPGEKREFATRLCGSQDLYGAKRSPTASINFITAHDGFTLKDLVSYDEKHNFENGEENRDGNSYNDSWNCGTEGPTTNKKILSLRERQMKNFLLALIISQGIPMIHMGDEYGHTRKGNNNPWCQDNDLNWFLWNQLQEAESFYRFLKSLIQFRKRHEIFRRGRFLTEKDIKWHGIDPKDPDWNGDQLFLAMTLHDMGEKKHDYYLAFNVHPQILTPTLPPPPEGQRWYLIVDTAHPAPDDFFEEERASVLSQLKYRMYGHSAIMLLSK